MAAKKISLIDSRETRDAIFDIKSMVSDLAVKFENLTVKTESHEGKLDKQENKILNIMIKQGAQTTWDKIKSGVIYVQSCACGAMFTYILMKLI